MGFKQRRIKPGYSFNDAAGVLVQAAVAIAENDVVAVSSTNGALAIVRPADATNLQLCQGKLWVAKHAIPVGGRGVILPWRRITFVTTGSSIGAAVWLTTAGAYTLAGATGGVGSRRVGTVVVVGAAGVGVIDLHPADSVLEVSNPTGPLGATPVIWITPLADAAGPIIVATVQRPMVIVNAWMVKTTGAGGVGDTCTILSNAVACAVIDLNNAAIGETAQLCPPGNGAGVVTPASLPVASGDAITATTAAGAGDSAGILYVMAIPG